MSARARRVVVVGSGIAGTAAALTLRARAPKLEVTMILGAAGATVLAGGAYDGDLPRSSEAREVLRELAYCTQLTEGAASRQALVATTAGILRSATLIDRAMLDLSLLENTTVLLPRVNHASWDADYLARAFEAAPAAQARGLRFRAVSARLVRETGELSMSDAELARINGSEARIEWLGAQLAPLRREFPDAGAILVPPWLPIPVPAQATLQEKVGLPLGEAMGLPTSPSGLRFMRARDACLASNNVDVVSGYASRIAYEENALTVTLADGTAVFAAAVILATGGVIAGGLRYRPAETRIAGELPVRSEMPFELTFAAPVTLGAHGRPLLIPGSLYGETPEAIAWPFVQDPLFERVGILTEAALAAPSVFACGDAAADAPRNWLSALESGAQAALATLLVV